MEEHPEANDYDICIPPLLTLDHVICFYCEQIYTLCGSNIKQTAAILDITEIQLMKFLGDELDFS